MNNRFFESASRATRLSPYFIFKIFCCLSIFSDLIRDKNNSPGECLFFGSIIGLRFFLPSLDTIKVNDELYHRAFYYLKNYGYRTKWANWYIDSTCGRQQLKEACKELNALSAYKKHISDAKIRWYHIDRSLGMRFGFVSEFILLSAFTCVYHREVAMQKMEIRNEERISRQSLRS